LTTWIKLHDNFWENPKVLAAGEDAALLYIQGLSYCSRNLTDGSIPTPALRNLTAKRDAKTLVRVLVREGLWSETATGWQVHDYLKVQRSREQVEAEREKARERQRKARVTASSRRDSGRTSGEVTPAVRVPDTETDTETETPLLDRIVDGVFAKVLADKERRGERIDSAEGYRRWWDANQSAGCRRRAQWMLEHYDVPTLAEQVAFTWSVDVPRWASPYLKRTTGAA
jgi:hypothetical protein